MVRAVLSVFSGLCLILGVIGVEVVKRGLGEGIDSMPSTMPTENRAYVEEQYQKFMEERRKQKAAEEAKKKQQQQGPPKPPPGISPKAMKLARDPKKHTVPLTEQVDIPAGVTWFGSQMDIGGSGKLYPSRLKDGAQPRKRVSVGAFKMDIDCVTNDQFEEFARATNYKTEAELYGWSFVFEAQASDATKEIVDGPNGFGRVKDATHWMAVAGADWAHPYGPDSDISAIKDHPVVHVSLKDADEFCHWADGRRVPSEKEWEYAARGGLVNQTYPWGEAINPELDGTGSKSGIQSDTHEHMNIWEGPFPAGNTAKDGFIGTNPVNHYPPNGYGLYNVLGNVWEWVKGGKDDTARVLRGGSFVDSIDGSFNHAVMVSTRQTNAADSAASNIGFRCALGGNKKKIMGDDEPQGDEEVSRPKPRKRKDASSRAKAEKKEMEESVVIEL